MRKLLCLVLLILLAAVWVGCGDSTHHLASLTPTSQLLFVRATGGVGGAATFRHSIELGTLRSQVRQRFSARAGLRPLLNSITNGSDSIVMMKNDGTGETVLANQAGWFDSVQFSLDGKWAVGSAWDDNSSSHLQIFVVNMTNLNNLQPVQLTADAENHYYPQLSPDNSTVVFVKDNNSAETGYAYTVKVTGGAENQIPTPSNVYVNFPTYTPDGKKIVFEEEDNDTISIMNIDGTGIKTLTNVGGTSYFDEFPSVSPDGKTIVFSRYGKDVDTDGEDIYIANIDGTKVKQLTTDGRNWDPMFVNEKIAFVSYRDNAGGGEIYSMNLDGSNVKRLTNNSLDEYFVLD